METWKTIEGYSNYLISSDGKLKSIRGNILNPRLNTNGYLYTIIRNDKGVRKTVKIHQLVARNFIPNHADLPEINHKDEIKTNNSINNLEWCTRKYNANYGTVRKRISDSKLKPVYQYDLNGILIREWNSIAEAVQHGFTQSKISQCCNNKRNKHKNCIWKFK